MQARQRINQLSKGFLNVVFPPKCLACQSRTSEANTVCPDCWNKLDFISDPTCEICGNPFVSQLALHSKCDSCQESPKPYTRARAVLRFNDCSGKLIHNFKYYDKTETTKSFASWMQRAGAELLDQTDIITPIPLHKNRLKKRKYNQAAMLAAELAKRSQKVYLPDLLVRTKETTSQSGLNRKQRHQNVKNAFEIYRKDLIKNKNIMLIDDVITTGATASECSKALLCNGVNQVFVLTLAKT